MNRARTYRRNIDFGESLAWTPPADAAEFYLWGKIGDTDSAIRWRRTAGWNIANAAAIDLPEAPHQYTITLTGPQIALGWTELQTMFDGFDSEIAQVTAHGADDALLSRDVYHIPTPSSTNAATIAAQERRILKQLLAAVMTEGNVNSLVQYKVSTPDGTTVERLSLAALDRRIAETRARIAWFEQAAEGNTLPRMEVW